MKRWMALLLCWAVLLTGCGYEIVIQIPGGTEPTVEPTVTSLQPATSQQPENTHKQVLMLYMVGSDLESEAGLASRDIEEILSSGIRFEDMTVYLCAGGSSYWWTDTISPQGTAVFEVTPEGLQPVYEMQNRNMAQPETLTEFLDFGYCAKAAEYYSLVMWNHGGGAVLGFGADENYDFDSLTLREMDEAFGNTALAREGKKLEWVGFDACLMGMIEVADMLSDHARYMIGSEEVVSGAGWDYSCLADLSREPEPTGAACSQIIIDAYRQYYECKVLTVPEYTLSALNLEKTDAVVTKLEALVESARAALVQGGYSQIARYRDRSKTFGKVSSNGVYDTVDLYDLADQLLEPYPEQASQLQKALEELVVCHASNICGSHGVAVYFPYENKANTEQWLIQYETAEFSPTYRRFLKTFAGTLSGETLAKWNVGQTVPQESSEEPGTYQIELTAQQVENYGHASFSVWEEDAPGSFICWLISRDVTLQDNGTLSSRFQGKRFYVGDSSGNCLPCHASEIERNEEYVKYSIPVFVIPAESDALFGLMPTYIHVRVDAAHPNGEILGYFREMYTEGNPFPTRNLLQIKEGDIVIPFLYAREIVTREDGTLAPFEQWRSTSGSGADFKVKGDFRIAFREAETDVPYRYLFAITDTQGNQYFTDTTAA